MSTTRRLPANEDVEEAQRILIRTTKTHRNRAGQKTTDRVRPESDFLVLTSNEMGLLRVLVEMRAAYKVGKIKSDEYKMQLTNLLDDVKALDQRGFAAVPKTQQGAYTTKEVAGVDRGFYRPLAFVPFRTPNMGVTYPKMRNAPSRTNGGTQTDRARLAGKGRLVTLLGAKHLASMGLKRMSWASGDIKLSGFGRCGNREKKDSTYAFMTTGTGSKMAITRKTKSRVAQIAYRLATGNDQSYTGPRPKIEMNRNFDSSKYSRGPRDFDCVMPDLNTQEGEMLKLVCAKNGSRWAVVKAVNAYGKNMQKFKGTQASSVAGRSYLAKANRGITDLSGNGMGE